MTDTVQTSPKFPNKEEEKKLCPLCKNELEHKAQDFWKCVHCRGEFWADMDRLDELAAQVRLEDQQLAQLEKDRWSISWTPNYPPPLPLEPIVDKSARGGGKSRSKKNPKGTKKYQAPWGQE